MIVILRGESLFEAVRRHPVGNQGADRLYMLVIFFLKRICSSETNDLSWFSYLRRKIGIFASGLGLWI